MRQEKLHLRISQMDQQSTQTQTRAASPIKVQAPHNSLVTKILMAPAHRQKKVVLAQTQVQAFWT